jgi:hypothetical protein
LQLKDKEAPLGSATERDVDCDGLTVLKTKEAEQKDLFSSRSRELSVWQIAQSCITGYGSRMSALLKNSIVLSNTKLKSGLVNIGNVCVDVLSAANEMLRDSIGML